MTTRNVDVQCAKGDVGDELLAEQMAYYRARAPEYDEWFLRQGRYDLGEEHRRRWTGEVAMVEEALGRAEPAGDVLELACGTGLWTRHLVGRAARVTAVDASPEVIALNRTRLGGAPNVEYVQADLFRWSPPRAFDFVFFGFWLSHVPPEKLEPFWRMVRSCLGPSGKVFFVDSQAPAQGSGPGVVEERQLNDGRRFQIVKIFHQPSALAARLRALGWQAEVSATPTFFIHGTAQPGSGATSTSI
jgi:SAM-dependent methyltransferase